MSITLFQVVGGGGTLPQIKEGLKRGRIARSAEQPDDGEDVVLEASAGGLGTVGDGNLQAVMADEYLDVYSAPDGALLSVVKVRRIDTVLAADARHVLVLAGRQAAGPIASKASRIAFMARDDPVVACLISPDRICAFMADHNARVLSCSWRVLRIPALGGASLNGSRIGASSDFKGFDRQGLKNSVRVRLPALGITLSINREAPLHFYTRHELDERLSFIRRHVVPLCR